MAKHSTALIIHGWILIVFIHQIQGEPEAMFEVTGVSQDYEMISCIVADQYVEDQALVCVGNSVKTLDLSTSQYVDIVGQEFVKGYADGYGDDAEFNFIPDIYQLNGTTMVIVDYRNSCLRLVIDRMTLTYSGNCTKPGMKDGPLSDALFDHPAGLLAIGHNLMIADTLSHRIRKINLRSSIVSTEMKVKSLIPIYMTCVDSCDWLYTTYLHGVVRINRYTNKYEIISGKTNSEGMETGLLKETEFDLPANLLFINKTLLVVADNQNRRLVFLNLQTNKSSVLANIQSPWSMLLHKNFIFIGSTLKGVAKVDIGSLIKSEIRHGHEEHMEL